MKVLSKNVISASCGLLFALPLCLALSAVATAQKPTSPTAPAASPTPSPAPSSNSSGCTLPAGPSHTDAKTPSKITPEQASQLFALVDVLIKFSSDETGLPIKSSVKR